MANELSKLSVLQLSMLSRRFRLCAKLDYHHQRAMYRNRNYNGPRLAYVGSWLYNHVRHGAGLFSTNCI